MPQHTYQRRQLSLARSDRAELHSKADNCRTARSQPQNRRPLAANANPTKQPHSAIAHLPNTQIQHNTHSRKSSTCCRLLRWWLKVRLDWWGGRRPWNQLTGIDCRGYGTYAVWRCVLWWSLSWD